MGAMGWLFGSAGRLGLAQRAATLAGRLSRGRMPRNLPGPLSGWTNARDLPAPPPETFRDRWMRTHDADGTRRDGSDR